ncbi:glycosyltransferase family 4 protein [Terrimonas alba]|uniref:glycosyltransferase family 4 protein n=1 Tax=Terrimonas alba TaxID=3349636 RepID=UPI0035F3FBFD
MAGNKNTLIILTPGFAESEADTTCLPMQQQLVKSLRENNPDLAIKIISFQYPYHTNKYNWFDVEVIPFNGQNKGGLRRLWLRKKIFSGLDIIYKKEAVTGLLSFWYGECAAVGNKYARKKKLPHFCWISGQDARKENRYPGKIKLPPGSLVALSDFLQDEFEKNHHARPEYVIPPGIQPQPDTELIREKDIDLLAVGSLIPLKQHELFIEVVAEIKKTHSAIKAALVGKGVQMQKLQHMIYQLALGDSIILTGELPHPETLHMMRRSKILLHPSSYEGFSGVCMEALSEAAHIISFCQPMKTTIKQWHIVNSKEEMIKKVIAILKDKNTTYERVYPYTIKQTAQKINDLFKKR